MIDLLWERLAAGGVLAIADSAAGTSVERPERARHHLEGTLEGARWVAPFPHAGMGATSVFGTTRDGDDTAADGGGAEPVSMRAYKKAFSKVRSLEITQRVLESTASREHGMRTDATRRGTLWRTPTQTGSCCRCCASWRWRTSLPAGGR